jgi:1-acyl-sn-glycerol-3-phosphate acyltransferase
MFYHLTTPLMKLAFRVYFKKIHLSNLQLIPTDQPVILAANHPSAFIEPIILASWLDRTLHFVARGDLYLNSPFVRKLYDVYNLIPVFRLDDAGYGQLKTNYSSFERCFSVLKENGWLMILAEGRTKHEKRLRKIMKGTARIAFGTLEIKEDLDICIVPVGVNYTNSDQFRTDVMIDFGAPINLSEYLPTYKENSSRAVKLLTSAIEKGLSERVIHIESPEDEALVEMLLELRRNESKENTAWQDAGSATRLMEEKKIADLVNALSLEDKESLGKSTSDYFQSLRQFGASDSGMTDAGSGRLVNYLLYALAWLFWLPGFVLNILPLFLGYRAAKKMAKTVEFRASLVITFSCLLYVLYLLIIPILSLVTGNTWLLALLLLLPLSGVITLEAIDLKARFKERLKVNAMGKEAVAMLREKRANLLGLLNKHLGHPQSSN